MFERLVGLDVGDEESYRRYREHMIPILKRYGGGFRFDFRIADVLKSDTENKINRLFIIAFADEKSAEAFFADGDYLEVRKTYFEPAVRSATVLSAYNRVV